MADRFINYGATQKTIPIENRGFFDRVSDQYMTSAVVKTSAKILRDSELIFPSEPDYKWDANIPSGMENYYEQFSTTRSTAEARALAHQIRYQVDAEGRMSRDTGLQSLGAGLVAQLADPLTYVPVPGMYGVGLVKGALRGGTAMGGITAAGDLIGELSSPTATAKNTAALIASDVAFGAIFGAATGGILPRIVGPIGEKVGLPGLGMKPQSMGEIYMKAHAALDIGVAERINLEGLPYKINETGGTKVEIIRPSPERVDVLPAGVRSITPEIINPVYHGTPYHEKFPSFVDNEGNLVLYPSDNFNGAQVGVSFGKNREASAQYAGGDVSIRDYNPNIGMIFEIDKSALPNNVIDFDKKELFAPADPNAVDTISAIQAEVRAGVGGASLEDLRPFATIIPAGKWRVTPATKTSPFVPPKEYVGLRPEERVNVPAQEGAINLNTPELIMDYQNQPQGTFNNLNEWLNYNVNKAQNELAIPRIVDESDFDFDARISKMSLDETRAGRVPLNPGGTFLNRMTLLGSLHADAADLFGDDNVMMDAYQQVIGDFGTNSIAVQYGKAAVDSVFMRSEREKIKVNLASSQSIHAAYASYMAGKEVAVNKYRNIVTNFVANSWFVGNTIREGKVDMPTFRSMISAIAENPNNTHFNGMEIPQEVHIAAREHRKIYDYFEEKIRQYGLSDEARNLDYDIESLKRRETATQDAIRRAPRRVVPTLQATLTGLQEELRVATLAKDNLKAIPLLPRGVDNYVNHVWRIDQIEARRDEITKKITTLFARDQFEGAEDRAKKWVSHTLGETDEDVLSPGGSGGGIMYVAHRQINATFEEFGDFLETDIQLLMQHYVNKMVPALEMHRMFGDRTMKRKIDEMRTHLAIKYADLPEKQRLKKIGNQIQLIEDSRDRVLGTFGVSDASQWSLRGVRALKNLSTLNHMGSTVVAAITDPVRMMMRAGMGDTMRYALAHFDAGAEGLAMSKEMAKLAGQAGEFANWGSNARFQHGDSLIRANGTMVERGLDRAVPIFFMANGLTPWTIWMKEFTGGLSTHVIISDIQKIAKAVESGKPVDQKILKRMLAQGINVRDAVIISKMPIETYGPHKLKLANVKAWSGKDGDYAREKFLAALQGEIQSSIITASPGDKARIFDGVVYKSKSRYNVEKQISDLSKQRDEVLEQIRAIRSDAAIPTERAAPVFVEPAPVQAPIAAPLTKDEMIAPLLQQLGEIGKQSGMLKNSAARVGRGGSPLLGLPFQFMSFAVAAGPKLLGSMLNDRDRSRAMGALTMLTTGYLISRFWDNDPNRWDEMSADQKFYKAFDRSGLGGIISTMGATADTFDVGLGAALDWTQPYGPAKFSEKVGRIAGAGPGDVVSFAQALLDPDLSTKERASMIRRVTPGNNLFYLKGLFKSVGNALAEFVDDDGTGIVPTQFRGGSEPRPAQFRGDYEPRPAAAAVPPRAPLPIATPPISELPMQQTSPPEIVGTPVPQPVEPAPKATPIVEGDPGAREQTAWDLRQPEGESGRRDQAKWTLIDRPPQPEGNPGARDQTVWALSKKSRQDFVNSFVAAFTTATQATAPAEASGSGKPTTDTQPMDSTNKIDLSGPFKDTVSSGNPQYGLMWLKKNSQNEGYRKLASAILENGLGKTRVVIDMRDMNYAGITTFENDGTSTVVLYGSAGMDEDTFLHELLHAYTQQRWMTLSSYSQRNKRIVGDKVDRNDAAVKEFKDIWLKISTNIVRNTDPEYVKNNIGLSEFIRNPDEGLAFMMTNPSLKDYLKTIDVNGEDITPKSGSTKTMFDTFTGWLAKSLNLPPTKPTRSALDEIMSTGNNLIEAGKFVKPDGEFGLKVYLDTHRKIGTLPKP